RKSEGERPVVFTHVLGGASLRDRDHSRLPQHPRETYLCRSRFVSGGHAPNDAVLQQARLFDGGVRHDRDTTFLAPGQEIELDTAPAEIIEHLITGNRRSAGHLEELRHVRQVEVAHPPLTNLPFLHELREGAHGLCQGYTLTPVEQIQIK